MARRCPPCILALCMFVGLATSGGVGWAEERSLDEWIATLQKAEDWHVRRQAAEALKELKQPYAAQFLVEALKDNVPEVRAAAASALGVLNDSFAIEPLILRLEDEHPSVRQESAAALSRLTGQDFGDDPARWNDWWSRNRPVFGCGY